MIILKIIMSNYYSNNNKNLTLTQMPYINYELILYAFNIKINYYFFFV